MDSIRRSQSTWVVFLSVLLMAPALAWSLRQRGEPRNLSPGVGNTVSELRVDAEGNYFVARGDGRLQKYSGRDDSLLWSLNVRQIDSPEGLGIYDFVLTPEGELLVLGVTHDSLETVIYRITAGRTPSVLPFGRYPGFAPVSLALAPSGELFMLAFDAHMVNRIQATSGLTAPERTCNFFYQLDERGGIQRAWGPITFPPRDAPDFIGFNFDLQNARLIFTPLGETYLANKNKPLLEKVDLSTGRTTGRIPLPYRGLAYKVAFYSIDMISEHEAAYSMYMADEQRNVTGGQVRVLDLLTGESREVDSFDGRYEWSRRARVDASGTLRIYGSVHRNPSLVRRIDHPSGRRDPR